MKLKMMALGQHFLTAPMCITHPQGVCGQDWELCNHYQRNWLLRSPLLINEASTSLMYCLEQVAVLAAQCHGTHPWKCHTISQGGSSALFQNKTAIHDDPCKSSGCCKDDRLINLVWRFDVSINIAKVAQRPSQLFLTSESISVLCWGNFSYLGKLRQVYKRRLIPFLENNNNKTFKVLDFSFTETGRQYLEFLYAPTDHYISYSSRVHVSQ